MICPGSALSNTHAKRSNWYGRLHDILTETMEFVASVRTSPIRGRTRPPLRDSSFFFASRGERAACARRHIWLMHMRSLAEKNVSDSGPENVILVGHSSGAQAAMRYAELHAVRGIVLVAATYSDLGDAHERASGYYPKPNGKGGESDPYLFNKMKEKCASWVQFHSDDDPFIPLREAEKVRDGLGLSETYYVLPGRSHYFEYSPELLDAVLSLC